VIFDTKDLTKTLSVFRTSKKMSACFRQTTVNPMNIVSAGYMGKERASLLLQTEFEGKFPRIAGYPVLNGGMGGAGVHAARELLDGFPKGRRIKGIVIAIGVNDAARTSLRPDYFDEWEKSYLSIVRQAKALAVKTLAVNTVIPVEKGKPLGDQYFDLEAIERLNDIIRKVAASDHTLILIDNDATFRFLTSKQQAYTLDGVHLNAIGYASWKSGLAAAFKH
jgi:lysophospholipase L1-like esterase